MTPTAAQPAPIRPQRGSALHRKGANATATPDRPAGLLHTRKRQEGNRYASVPPQAVWAPPGSGVAVSAGGRAIRSLDLSVPSPSGQPSRSRSMRTGS